MPLWSPSASPETRVARATDGQVRILTHRDTSELNRLLDSDPVGHASVTATVRQRRTAAAGRGRQGALVLGIDQGGSTVSEENNGNGGHGLRAACWVGSNIIPVAADAASGAQFGTAVASLRRRVSSIFGRSEPVMALLASSGWTNYREVRDRQPLMAITAVPAGVKPLAGVRPSRMEEFRAVEQACAAMFTEELGFSPYSQGSAQYRDRIRELIQAGHSLVAVDPQTRRIMFKAELGAVTDQVVQIQGVWVDPQWRGTGLAAPGMAAVVEYSLQFAPCVSLYVNSWNTPAIRAYTRAGFQHCGTYATVLF